MSYSNRSPNGRPQRFPLLYVASIGRSGSTLLESILGAHPDIETAGELHLWPHELREPERPCGSGLLVDEDPFWLAMRNRVDPLAHGGPGLDHFREAHNAGRTLRLRHLRAFGPGTLSAQEAAEARVYAEHTRCVLEAFTEQCAEETGRRPRWVADSSKDPYRLAWLAHSDLFELKVIHIVRDPRAFVYSVTKSHVEGEASVGAVAALRRLYYTARQTGAWVVQNRLFSRLARYHLGPDEYCLLRYERLAADPEETFGELCDFLGVPRVPEAVAKFREGSPFALVGNPMRQDTRPIRLDERWKTRLPASSRLIATAVTAPVARRYGYH